MFKTYLTYFLFLSACLQLWSQEHQWEEPLFTNIDLGGDSKSDMNIDSDGYPYLIGIFENEISILDTTIYSSQDNGVFVAKFDINHNLIWARVIAEAKESTPNLTRVINNVFLEIDINNNVYPIIEYQDSIFIDNQLHTVDQSQSYYQDILILEMESSGQILNTFSIKGSCELEFGGLEVTNNNLYINISNYRNNLDTDSVCSCILNSDSTLYSVSNQALISKINKLTGEVNWIKTYQAGTSPIITSKLTTSSNSLYITGTVFYSGNLNFGTNSLSIPGIYTRYGYIAKFNLEGNYQWSKYYAVKGWDSQIFSQDIKINGSNNIVLLGYVKSQSVLNQVFIQNSFPLNGQLNNDENYFIINYDSSGNIVWNDISNGLGYDYCTSLDFDSQKNIYLAGNFTGQLIFNTDTLESNSSTKDILILSYDSLGNKRLAKTANGLGSESGAKICVDSTDNLHISGFVSGDSVIFGDYVMTPPSSGISIFLGKMTLSEPLNTSDYTPEQFKTSIYPNPNSGICSIYTEEEDIQQMNIYNSLGQKTQAFKYTNFTNSISISQLKPGIYIVELISKSGKQVTQKLIVEELKSNL